MTLDAIIIAEAGASSFSATNPLKLAIDGQTANIQLVAEVLAGKERSTAPEGNEASWDSAPRLNGVFLLNYLTRQRFRVELVRCYDMEQTRFARLLSQSPRAVVISTTFINHKQELCDLVEDIRRQAPDIFIITGGPFVFTSYLLLGRSSEGAYDTDSAREQFLFLETAVEPRVDLYVVSRRGELSLGEILRRLKGGGQTGELPNTARLSGNRYLFSRRVEEPGDGEEAAIEWAELPDAVFNSGVVPLQASMGCPYNCAFCNFIKDRRLNRIRPVEAVVSDMKTIARRGGRYVWFVDDNFRLGRRGLSDLCRRFIEEDLPLKWMSFMRADALLDEDMELLKRAGCQEVQLGIESADPQILQNMNKGVAPSTYHTVLKRLRSVGINCSCYFIFGFPGETEQSAQRTRTFIKTHDRMDLEGHLALSLFPFILSPLSPIYAPKARETYALSGYMNQWTHRTMDSDQALLEIQRTFMEMENAGAIYRGDNQDMLSLLPSGRRKAFHATRQALAKAALEGPLTREAAAAAFRQALPAFAG